jgi:hypothetical protein
MTCKTDLGTRSDTFRGRKLTSIHDDSIGGKEMDLALLGRNHQNPE